MRAWPFLISANLTHDASAVIVPDFLNRAGEVRELLRAAQGFNTEPGEAIALKYHVKDLGDLISVFQVVNGTERLFGEDSDTPLRDRRYRQVRVIFGLVFRQGTLPAHVTQTQLDFGLKQFQSYFRSYWQAEDWNPVTSESLELDPSSNSPLRLRQLPLGDSGRRAMHGDSSLYPMAGLAIGSFLLGLGILLYKKLR